VFGIMAATDSLKHYAQAQCKLDPVSQYMEHTRQDQEAAEAAQEASQEDLDRALGKERRAAKWWEDLHYVDRDSVADLQHGPTAYRLIGDKGPVVVLLHGAFSHSYVWIDLVKRLSDTSDLWATARTKQMLIFDFYGRGRSPWPASNPRCTAEFLSAQLEQLLRHLGLEHTEVVLVGYDMGSVVAAAFAARNHDRVLGILALGPVGTCRSPLNVERAIQSTPFWGDPDQNLGKLLEDLHRAEFYDHDDSAEHSSLRALHISMISWQIANTPRFLEGVKSTLRYFPLSSPTGKADKSGIDAFLDPLFGSAEKKSQTGLSIFQRISSDLWPVYILWGAQDTLHEPAIGEHGLRNAVPRANISYVGRCGHAAHLERFNETAIFVKDVLMSILGDGRPKPFPPALMLDPAPTADPESNTSASMRQKRAKVAEDVVQVDATCSMYELNMKYEIHMQYDKIIYLHMLKMYVQFC
jgi:pimeloyl-ACP methyl ester carboxylesterase